MKIVKKIIFLCTGNSCRSQMAEGFARFFSKKRLEENIVQSAGTHPESVNQFAVHVMKELSVDISSQMSKNINTINFQEFDLIVTVCDDAYGCVMNLSPLGFKSKVLHNSFSDPAKVNGSKEEQLIVYREVRDKIKAMVISILDNYSQIINNDKE